MPAAVAVRRRWSCSLSAHTFGCHPQGDDVFPMPGTRNPKHVEDNVAALEFSRTLTVEEIAELEAAVPAAQASGGPSSMLAAFPMSLPPRDLVCV